MFAANVGDSSRRAQRSRTCSPTHLAEQIIQGLVRVGDHQRALAGAVVVQDVHDLHRRVRLARAWWAHHHGQPRLHPTHDGLCLHRREAHAVLRRQVLRVWAWVNWRVRLYHQLALAACRLLRRAIICRLALDLAAYRLLLLFKRGEGDAEGALKLRAAAAVPKLNLPPWECLAHVVCTA